MAHRKDRKEALRLERERREAEARAAAQRKRLVGFGAAAALAIAAIVVVVVLVAGGSNGESGASGGGDVFPEGGSVAEQQEFDLATAARNAECELTDTRATSRQHTTDPSQRVRYEDNPPTSGRHYEIPAEDGLYQEAPSDTELVHSLEHGRVIVWVKPSLPREDREQLRALFDEDTYQMLMVPRSDMPDAVAATAWSRDPTPNGTGRTLACPRFNENVIDAIRTFRDEHRSNGPEPVP
jgi:Protein of unknown function (DUF3105)